MTQYERIVMQIKCQCPYCRTKFSVDEEFIGQETECPSCNKNFRIKVAGDVDGVRVNKLVGVRGLLAILGSCQKLVKMVLRAFDCLADKCACKIYGGATVTFYAK